MLRDGDTAGNIRQFEIEQLKCKRQRCSGGQIHLLSKLDNLDLASESYNNVFQFVFPKDCIFYSQATNQNNLIHPNPPVES